jgi:2-oxoglutarate ferredoxin oxidoreductase subunit alpha
MSALRAAKVDRVADDVPPLAVEGDADADLLVVGWGSTLGTIRAAARRVRERGYRVATAHLRHLSPMPGNTGEVVRRYPVVLIPEMNSGHLAMLIRARYLVDAKTFAKIQGLPIFAEELETVILEVLS